jgi:hypothetical protein
MTTAHKRVKGKPRRMKPYAAKWEKQANSLARGFCPAIYPCAHCNGPVVRGFCCDGCGSTNPEGHK